MSWMEDALKPENDDARIIAEQKAEIERLKGVQQCNSELDEEAHRLVEALEARDAEVEAAIAETVEKCAKIAEGLWEEQRQLTPDDRLPEGMIPDSIARRIRELGGEKPTRDESALEEVFTDLEMADRQPTRSDSERLEQIRQAGWMVVCHNDYMQLGHRFTFWSFAKDGCYIKGEGRTDTEALDEVMDAAKGEEGGSDG